MGGGEVRVTTYTPKQQAQRLRQKLEAAEEQRRQAEGRAAHWASRVGELQSQLETPLNPRRQRGEMYTWEHDLLPLGFGFWIGVMVGMLFAVWLVGA